MLPDVNVAKKFATFQVLSRLRSGTCCLTFGSCLNFIFSGNFSYLPLWIVAGYGG